MKPILLAVLGLNLFAAASEPLTVNLWTDKTSLYPGDRLQYVARVEHAASIEFVQDHVGKDQLTLTPFEILSVATAKGDLAGGRKFFEVRLLLTTYDATHSDVTVPSFNLFYFRQAGKDNAPAESLTVPALKLGLRSTIVDPAAPLREYKPPLPLSHSRAFFPGLLGWIGLLAVLGYVLSRVIVWIRSGFWKRKMTERIRKKSMREAFDEIRQAPTDSGEEIESFYTKASAVLRGIAAEQVGDCDGLTPRELETTLRKSGDPESHAAALAELLHECDLARYSPGGVDRARGAHTAFLGKFEALIERR